MDWAAFIAIMVAAVAVVINGIPQLAYATSLGFAPKPAAFAYLVGAAGNAITGSVTPIAAQAETLTVSGLIKNMNQRVAALLLAAVVGITLGLTGSVTAIAEWAGTGVVLGMMAGVGLILAEVAYTMFISEKITAGASIMTALVVYALTKDVVWTIAASVVLSTLVFVFALGRRVDLISAIQANEQSTDQMQSNDARFWKKEYWEEFKLIKPEFGWTAIIGGLGFICLNIGSNTAFGNITASIAGTTQNLDHLTVINSLADIPSVMFGGAPIEAIISGTAGAPNPVLTGVVMMVLTAVLLLTGVIGRIGRYVPAESIAGFLITIGVFLTFVPNLNGAVEGDDPAAGVVALGVTAISKNPFIGLVAGVLTRFFGHFVGL